MLVRHEWRPNVDSELQELCAAEGLEVVGVCDAQADNKAIARAQGEYRSWLESGFHGSMKYLTRHEKAKWQPGLLLPGTRSIIFVALNYYQRTTAPGSGRGRIARYAIGRDYHKELGRRLRRIARRLAERFPDDRFRSFTDATPLAERWFAERAGVGFIGRNTLLINGALGSWCVIGEILSTRHWQPSEQARGRHGACPGPCRRCIDVCPTGALYDAFRIDASRCISYLTIEHDGIIPEELWAPIGSWIFGCDLCQEVCPLNLRSQETTVERFVRPIAGDSVLLADILAIEDDAEFTEKFAGSPVMRAKRRRLVRNAIVVSTNLRLHNLRPRIEVLQSDADDVIAYHAQRAISSGLI